MFICCSWQGKNTTMYCSAGFLPFVTIFGSFAESARVMKSKSGYTQVLIQEYCSFVFKFNVHVLLLICTCSDYGLGYCTMSVEITSGLRGTVFMSP